jgi:hypothetical protein
VTPKAFFSLLLPGVPDVPWLLALGCSIAGIAIAWEVKRRTGAPVAAMFPVAVFLSLWASPHALVYEWALLVGAAVVLWERFPDLRDAWLCLWAAVWVGLAISTSLAKSQAMAGWPVVFQLGVPLLGAAGWLSARELARSSGAHARPPDVQPVPPAQPDQLPTGADLRPSSSSET